MATEATFILNWKVGWAEFGALSEKAISKIMIVSHNRVALQLKIVVRVNEKRETRGINDFYVVLYYNDGPLSEVDCDCIMNLVKPNGELVDFMTWRTSTPLVLRGYGWRWTSLKCKADSQSFQKQMGITADDPLIFRIELKIPLSAFQYHMEFPFVEVSPTWLFDLFENINESASRQTDLKFVSQDETIFYCHKLIINRQSDAFEAMFRNALTADEKKDTYRFPTLSKDALHCVLQYLYTGLTAVNDLSTIDLIETAHFANQYYLDKLAKSCEAGMWKRLDQDVESSVEIIRYADLRGAIYLKRKAFDALADELDKVTSRGPLFQQFGGGVEGGRLSDEFAQFCARRVTISSIQ